MTGFDIDTALPFTKAQLEAVAKQSPKEAQPILEQWTFAMYGRAMLLAQSFEQMLAALNLVITARPSNQTTEKGLRRRIERRLTKIRHLADSAAEEIRRDLVGAVDADLLEEIEFVMGWRNRLAHSYLRQRLVPEPPTRGKVMTVSVDTVYELLEISQAFAAVNEQITAAQNEIMSQWELSGGVPVSTELLEWAQTSLVEILSTKAPSFQAWQRGTTENDLVSD